MIYCVDILILEISDITTDLNSVENIVNNSMPIDSTTLDEMEKFLGMHKLLKLTQQVIENLSHCASVKEIDFSREKFQPQ